MEVTIKNKPAELKLGIRALMMYENIAGKAFRAENLEAIITLFYCIVVTSAKDYSITYDQFLDWLDENPTKSEEFSEWFLSVSAVNEEIKKN